MLFQLWQNKSGVLQYFDIERNFFPTDLPPPPNRNSNSAIPHPFPQRPESILTTTGAARSNKSFPIVRERRSVTPPPLTPSQPRKKFGAVQTSNSRSRPLEREPAPAHFFRISEHRGKPYHWSKLSLAGKIITQLKTPNFNTLALIVERNKPDHEIEENFFNKSRP